MGWARGRSIAAPPVDTMDTIKVKIDLLAALDQAALVGEEGEIMSWNICESGAPTRDSDGIVSALLARLAAQRPSSARVLRRNVESGLIPR